MHACADLPVVFPAVAEVVLSNLSAQVWCLTCHFWQSRCAHMTHTACWCKTQTVLFAMSFVVDATAPSRQRGRRDYHRTAPSTHGGRVACPVLGLCRAGRQPRRRRRHALRRCCCATPRRRAGGVPVRARLCADAVVHTGPARPHLGYARRQRGRACAAAAVRRVAPSRSTHALAPTLQPRDQCTRGPVVGAV